MEYVSGMDLGRAMRRLRVLACNLGMLHTTMSGDGPSTIGSPSGTCFANGDASC